MLIIMAYFINTNILFFKSYNFWLYNKIILIVFCILIINNCLDYFVFNFKIGACVGKKKLTKYIVVLRGPDEI